MNNEQEDMWNKLKDPYYSYKQLVARRRKLIEVQAKAMKMYKKITQGTKQ